MLKIKVRNMTSPRTGKEVANQFIISYAGNGASGNFDLCEHFQSYASTIAVRTRWGDEVRVELDETYWNYSSTTSKYRNRFLKESTKETQDKIKNGAYKLTNLN